MAPNSEYRLGPHIRIGACRHVCCRKPLDELTCPATSDACHALSLLPSNKSRLVRRPGACKSQACAWQCPAPKHPLPRTDARPRRTNASADRSDAYRAPHPCTAPAASMHPACRIDALLLPHRCPTAPHRCARRPLSCTAVAAPMHPGCRSHAPRLPHRCPAAAHRSGTGTASMREERRFTVRFCYRSARRDKLGGPANVGRISTMTRTRT